jgi:branched-chain amino acid transport system substrate-binding protein
VTSGDRPAGDATGADARTFLIADVRGYTRYTQQHGDEEAARLAARFAELARQSIEEHGGQLLELRGDEALGVFTSTRDALRAAVGLQALVQGESGEEALPLGVGIGLDAGEAVAVEGGYRGGALNLAARLCSLAAPGEILASETVVGLARRVDGIRYEERGTQRFKGLEHPVRVVEVVPEAGAAQPTGSRRTSWRRFRRRHLTRGRIALAALLAVAAVAAIGALVVSSGEEPAEESAGALALDPGSGDELASVPLGTAPSAVTIGEGSVWVLDADDKTISQIDPESQELERTFSTSSTPTDIAAGAGALWVGNGDPESGSEGFPISVSRLDVQSQRLVETTELPPAPPGLAHYGLPGGSFQRIAASPDAIWVINPGLTVSRIDPRSNRIVATVEDVQALSIAAGEGDVWVTEAAGVAEIDPGDNTVARRVRLEAEFLAGIAIGGGSVWVTDPLSGSLWRVETGTKPQPSAIEVDPWVSGIAFGEGAVWATNEIADTVYRLDPRADAPERIDGIAAPRGVAAGDGDVWVSTSKPPSRDAELPESVCDDVYFEGTGSPDVLLVSDLTLEGVAGDVNRAMVQGLRLALEQREFEAGAFSVGYQSCDNATAQSESVDFFRCGSNAKAYAHSLRVVGVFGSYTSPCSFIQIPITNGAKDGPLAMVSPSNTFDGLTFDESLYPTGTRSFFRLVPTERYQGGSHVQLAKQLGDDRLFVLESSEGHYAEEYVERLRETARRVGIEIVGSEKYSEDVTSHEGLVQRVAAARPESVAVVGILTPASGALLRELRAALGPGVSISAADGFGVPDALREVTGPAARLLYVALPGVANRFLPPRGKQFLAAFAASNGGDPGPDLAASYGAQGMEILLDAIARSDGTRASVTEQLSRTRVANGILGDVSWDARGDLHQGPVTFTRLRGDEFVPDRVVTVKGAPSSAP